MVIKSFKDAKTLFEKVWLLAPVAIWFSYRPLIRFGQDSTMYFELSVTLVYLVVLAIAGLPEVWRDRQRLASNRAVLLVMTFVWIGGASLLWTSNPARGLLTFLLTGALAAVFVASVAAAETIRRITPVLTRILIMVAVVMSLISILQLLAGIWLTPDITQLCRGCVSTQFGFARPNVFAIEPQFFANMLLVPALVLLHMLVSKKRPERYVRLSVFIVVLALFLTLSRGAIFAFIIGLVLLLALQFKKLQNLSGMAFLIIAGFVCCLSLQGVAAAANPKIDTTFWRAVSASVNQISLGMIDISAVEEKPQATKEKPGSDNHTEDGETAPNFDGYVAESTDVRRRLAGLALRSWSDSPGRIVAGVGLGGSGVTLRDDYPKQVNNREIVQNEYIEILMENGIIGLGVFTTMIGCLIFGLRRNRWTWAIVLALLVQWNFFSGYPNAIHIYLTLIVLAVAYAMPSPKYKNR